MREPPGPLWGRAASCCLWPRWCSGRRRARPPARLGGLTSFGAAPRSPPVPSGPSGALHTSGAGCADDWLGASARCPARPCRHPPAPRPGPAGLAAPSAPVVPGVLTCGSARRLEARPCPPVPPAPSTPAVLCRWHVAGCVGSLSGPAPPPHTCAAIGSSSPSGALHAGGAVSLACGWVRVVTNVVNPRCFSCGFLPRCYKRRQSEGFFAENAGFWAQIDDVCNRVPREAI